MAGEVPGWSGDMLDRPEMVDAFATQLRRVLADQADYVARIRREAVSMWAANPPEGYGSFEAWWRHRWVTTPFAAIQEHLEEAAKLTFALEARYRKGRHEIPAARQAAAEAKQAQALPRGADPKPPTSPRQAESEARRAALSSSAPPEAGEAFMDMIRRGRSA